jgi:hypothetical protein
MKKLFLDDIRSPKDAIGLVPSHMNQFYWANDWDVVRSHDEFVDWIVTNGVPDFVSFDHDLADEHYIDFMGLSDGKEKTETTEKTGYESAKWLVYHCLDKGVGLPEYQVHSANPVGKANIQGYLENAKKHLL